MTRHYKMLYSVQSKGHGNGIEYLKGRFAEVATLPRVECPVCGQFDNDWPEREGLCCACWCAAFQLLTTGRPDGDKEPSLADVQRIIGRIVHDGKEYPAFAERIRKYRESTGTLRMNPESLEIPASPEIPEHPESPATPATPKKPARKRNKEWQREYNRKYREAHKGKYKALARRWYQENRDKAIASAIRWQDEHREQWERYRREYNAAHAAGEEK